jgi:hypothetical protein
MPELRLIVSVGKAAEPAAAALTELRPGSVVRAPSLATAWVTLANAPAGIGYIVLESQHLSTNEMLTGVAEATRSRPEQVVGVLSGATPSALLRRVQSIPSVPQVAPPGAEQVFVDALGVRFETARSVEVRRGMPNAATAAEDLLFRRSELLLLAAHSNGFDIDGIGPSLCALNARESTAATGVMPCFNGAPCSRRRSGHHPRSVASVTARRVIAATCWGVSKELAYDFEHTAGAALIHNPLIESLLTTMRVVHFDAADIATLYYLANDGYSFGAIASRWNAFRLWRGYHAEMVCFGDPETCLSPGIDEMPVGFGGSMVIHGSQARRRDVKIRSAAPVERVVVVGSRRDGILSSVVMPDGVVYATLEKDVNSASLALSEEDQNPLLCSPSELFTELEQVGDYLSADGQPSRLVSSYTKLRQAVASWPLASVTRGAFVAQETLVHTWGVLKERLDAFADAAVDSYLSTVHQHIGLHTLRYWERVYVDRPGLMVTRDCSFCGGTLDERVLVHRACNRQRLLGHCRSCGPSYDVPSHGRVSLELPEHAQSGSVVGASFRLQGSKLPRVPARAVFVLQQLHEGSGSDSDVAGGDVTYDTPHDAHCELRIPDQIAPGVYHLAAMVTMGAALHFFRRPIRVALHVAA